MVEQKWGICAPQLFIGRDRHARQAIMDELAIFIIQY